MHAARCNSGSSAAKDAASSSGVGGDSVSSHHSPLGTPGQRRHRVCMRARAFEQPLLTCFRVDVEGPNGHAWRCRVEARTCRLGVLCTHGRHAEREALGLATLSLRARGFLKRVPTFGVRRGRVVRRQLDHRFHVRSAATLAHRVGVSLAIQAALRRLGTTSALAIQAALRQLGIIKSGAATPRPAVRGQARGAGLMSCRWAEDGRCAEVPACEYTHHFDTPATNQRSRGRVALVFDDILRSTNQGLYKATADHTPHMGHVCVV